MSHKTCSHQQLVSTQRLHQLLNSTLTLLIKPQSVQKRLKQLKLGNILLRLKLRCLIHPYSLDNKLMKKPNTQNKTKPDICTLLQISGLVLLMTSLGKFFMSPPHARENITSLRNSISHKTRLNLIFKHH